MISNQNNNTTNNNSADLGNQSGNMYSYNDDSPKKPPHESNAIRRSLGEGVNPNINILPGMAQTRYLDQFQKPSEPNIYEGGKNENLPEYPNYNDNKSSEQIIPRLQDNRLQNKIFPPEQKQTQLPLYLPKPRELKKFYPVAFIIIAIYHILMIALIGCFFNFSNLKKDDYEYHFFKDIFLMIFIGFGMLYTMLKDHQWSSVAIVLFFEIISIEFSFFCHYLWYNTFSNEAWKTKIDINYKILSDILYNSATVVITLGALIGKLTIIQYFFISILETFFASLNYFLCYERIEGIDNGGSIYISTFGSIFGILMSIILFCRDSEYSKISNNPHNNSDYYSNMFSFIGSLFLWLYFPSFNIANIQINDSKISEIFRYRGIINTYLSMCGSVISTFIVSPLIYKGKIKIEHLLNGTYVGGIIIGGCCTICFYAWAALLIGSIGGAISTLCLWKLKQILKQSKLEDTLGILHIFAIPGILGGFLTCIFVSALSNKVWGENNNLGQIIFKELKSYPSHAGLEVATILITLAISGFSGIISGFIVNSMNCEKNEIYFVDSELFIEDENIPLPEWKYPRQNESNLSSSGNKLDEQEREVNIDQGA